MQHLVALAATKLKKYQMLHVRTVFELLIMGGENA
jgi:hypothetical protein